MYGRHHHGRRQRRHGRHFGPWTWQGRFYERGEIPLALLSLLEERPKHGYELMKDLEARSGGVYRASAGSVYPNLQQLQDQGLVASTDADGGKRIYELTAAGRERIAAEAESIAHIWRRADDEEWGDWGDFADPVAAEIIGPAVRLMKASVRAVKRTRGDPEQIDRIRDALERARREIEEAR